MKKAISLVCLLVFLTAPSASALDFMQKSDPGEIVDALGNHWAGPFKAITVIAGSDSYGGKFLSLKLTGLSRWPYSYSEMDWFVMQAAVSSGKNVWLFMDANRTLWYYIALGQKPPGG